MFVRSHGWQGNVVHIGHSHIFQEQGLQFGQQPVELGRDVQLCGANGRLNSNFQIRTADEAVPEPVAGRAGDVDPDGTLGWDARHKTRTKREISWRDKSSE